MSSLVRRLGFSIGYRITRLHFRTETAKMTLKVDQGHWCSEIAYCDVALFKMAAVCHLHSLNLTVLPSTLEVSGEAQHFWSVT